MKNFMIFGLTLIILACEKDTSIVDTNNPCPPIDIAPCAAYDDPVWHPSGEFIGFNHTPIKRITYPYGEHCQGEIEWEMDSTGFWLIKSDGTDMHRIFPYELQTPAWSPDGEWIAFVNNAQIFKMRFTGTNFDTTTITQLTHEGSNFFPAWSPDGNRIAYDSNVNNPVGGYSIWKMKSDGSNKNILVSGRMADWNVNDIHVIFIGFHREIFRVNTTDTSEVVRLTSLNQQDIYATYNSNPKYLPDGENIVFLSAPKNKISNLCIMDSNGQNIRQLTEEGVGFNGIPFSWSPDGLSIVYLKYRADDWTYENGTLWIMNIQRGEKIQLTFNYSSTE